MHQFIVPTFTKLKIKSAVGEKFDSEVQLNINLISSMQLCNGEAIITMNNVDRFVITEEDYKRIQLLKYNQSQTGDSFR